MKRIFIAVGFLAVFMLSCLIANAKTNILHSITLEKYQNGYNILLDTDNITKVSKKNVSDNEIVLDLYGIKSSDTVNALYKGTDNIDNLVIENTGNNSIKIYITAQDIKHSSVITKSLTGENILVPEQLPMDKTLWGIFVLVMFGLVFVIAKKHVKEDEKIGIKKDIKEREIALYRQYRKNFTQDMNLNYKNAKMHSMIKTIDRKIDERLTNMTLK